VNHLIALGFWILAIWLIRRDTARRDGISPALWIPTLWAGILLSRPLSMWLGFGGGTDTLEGSPLDRNFYFGTIILAFITLVRRNLNWAQVLTKNWPIFLFYGYCLISVLWADSPVASFKRWFKDLGNIFVALVILTERNPQQAFRAVFFRCACVLLPLSIIFLRYFPSLGRRYLRGGGLEVIGVTTQKNSLGALVLVCGLVLIWDWIENSKPGAPRRNKFERYLPVVLLSIGAYLLHLCDSQTSILCMIIGAVVVASVKLPIIRKRVAAFGLYAVGGILAFFALDSLLGIRDAILGTMGRDATFTGRTDVWRELLALNTDPIVGTGFCSFWSNDYYQSNLPEWVAFSAHNGYLEVYIDGGYIEVFLLVLMLLVVGLRINRQLAVSGNYSLIRFATLLVILLGDISESHFTRMSPLWFMFLLTALELPRHRRSRVVAIQTESPNLRTANPVSPFEPVPALGSP
jgi:exopolysaccharide production protein ExoQ